MKKNLLITAFALLVSMLTFAQAPVPTSWDVENYAAIPNGWQHINVGATGTIYSAANSCGSQALRLDEDGDALLIWVGQQPGNISFKARSTGNPWDGIFKVQESVDGTKFTNIGDAFWWTLVTVTTVGYGDIYPITTEGRIVATFLMFSGIAILGVFISTLGAAIIDNKQKSSSLADETKTLIKSKIDNLENLSHADITLLNEMIKNTHENLRNKDFDA